MKIVFVVCVRNKLNFDETIKKIFSKNQSEARSSEFIKKQNFRKGDKIIAKRGFKCKIAKSC